MPTKQPYVTVVLDDNLLKKIQDFRFENRIENRSTAIRMILEAGLKALTKPVKPTKPK
jgi:metal-responsive CopG/Arc/MetJ family transcriptional regulator